MAIRSASKVQVRSRRRATQGQRRTRTYVPPAVGIVAKPQLLHLMSETLSVLYGEILLYNETLERNDDTGTRSVLSAFLLQTRRHAQLLEEALLELGGSTSDLSPGAIVQQQRVDAMLHLEVTPERRQITDLENLLLLEVKAQLDWMLLSEVLPRVEDPAARSVLSNLLEEVDLQSSEHLDWVKHQLQLQIVQAAVQP